MARTSVLLRRVRRVVHAVHQAVFADHVEIDRHRVRRMGGHLDIDLSRRLPSDLIMAAAEVDPEIGPISALTPACRLCLAAWTPCNPAPRTSTPAAGAHQPRRDPRGVSLPSS
jgi:hypothetical protein